LVAGRGWIRWIGNGMAVAAARALELLTAAHERGRLAHAFLISGAARSGKRDLAARVIGLVNPPADAGGGDLFGEAPAEEAAELDALEGEFVRLVRPRSKSRRIPVEDIRGLEQSLHMAAPSGVWKVGVVVDADRMFDEAANAFLKTLEEPPPGCLLLLLTDHSEVLLPTIRSRCVEIVLQARERLEVLGPEEQEGFVEILAAAAEKRSAKAALRAKAAFEALLAGRRSEVEGRREAAYKEEVETYRGATEGSWLEEREKHHAAMSASEYLAAREALVEWLIAWLGDAVLAKVGVTDRAFPHHAALTARVADGEDLDALLGRLEALQGLQDLLATNVPENLSIEVCFLKAFGE